MLHFKWSIINVTCIQTRNTLLTLDLKLLTQNYLYITSFTAFTTLGTFGNEASINVGA